jgi:hypothetical protein
MLRPFEDLVRLLRRHSPGGRERLAFRLLHSIVVEPLPRPVPSRAETGQAARGPAR